MGLFLVEGEAVCICCWDVGMFSFKVDARHD